MKFLITVKLPRNPNHDPTDKLTGECPAFGGLCSDITGQHHTNLVEAESLGLVQLWAKGEGHTITRVETVV